MAVAKSTTKSVAVIIPTVRPGRNSPKFVKFVLESIKHTLPQNVTIKVIDLAEWKFPAFDGAEVPMMVSNADLYANEFTRKWSREVSSQDGFIFLVPEYNGSYPGLLKNALDYLYNEWIGKTAMIVSYGARPANLLHGGKHFADALNINSMKVSGVIPTISISTMDREKMSEANELVFYEKEVEDQHRKEIVEAWDATLKLLEVSPASA